MKIEAVHVHPLVYKPVRPYGNSTLMNYERRATLVEIVTSNGASGWGDAPGGNKATAAMVRQAAEVALGYALADRRTLVDTISGLFPGAGRIPAAFETAILDAHARELGVNVAALLGGTRRRRVPAYASGGYYYPHLADRRDHLVAEVSAAKAKGFRAYKMKVGRKSVAEDLADVRAVRDAVGDSMLLMADSNCAHSFSAALAMGRGLEELGVHWFEEPLPKRDLAGYRELRAKLDVPIAGGEGYLDLQEFHQAAEARALDILQPDVATIGGYSRIATVAALAEAAGFACVPHCWADAFHAVSTLHFLATLPERLGSGPRLPPMLEYDVTENRLREQILVVEPRPDVDGCFAAPEGPGLGIEVNREALQEFADS